MHIACYIISAFIWHFPVWFIAVSRQHVSIMQIKSTASFSVCRWINCIFPFWLVARASVKVSLQRLSSIWARGLIVIKSVLNTACWYGSDVEMSDVSPQTQSKQILSNGTALFPWVYFTSSMVHLWEHCAGFETQSQSYLRHSDSIVVNSLYASFHSCFC